ncbi:Gfo/Idh/MocA family oxidoreductase [Hoeflea sp. G2-23]|uniref:Gfo/Idh/MocA family oxidoreductase n=1 Tax=Hoeflea algicola TaxID=2983763 RepID=A0ABT3Z625_9HYPH|nr:Gfo/Idh/MocA family oxidoreductase [Hoeflea algicola]MCY0146824.1 Gfo/Idh/MocA family oxidoreductase [Hoeflea algicola]
MTNVKLGLVGCGPMGAKHFKAVHSLPGVEIAAVCDKDHARAKFVAAQFPSLRADPAVFDNAGAMCSKIGLDGVIIATSDFAHLDPVKQVAAFNIPIFLEKPLASTVEDADAIIDACAAAPVQLAVGQILRFEPAYLSMYQAVQDGRLGRFVSAFLRRHSLQSVAERLAPTTNVLDYLSIHDFDQLRWINPGEITEVSARAAKGPIYEKHGSPDAVYTVINFADGGMACVESAWSLTSSWGGTGADTHWQPFGDVRFDLYGSDGFLSLDFRMMNVIGVSTQHGFMAPENRHWPDIHGRTGGALREELIDFVHMITTGTAPVVNGYEARKAVVIVDAAKKSLANGGAAVRPLPDRVA